MGERSCLLLKIQSLVLKLKSTYVDGLALFLCHRMALRLVGCFVVGGWLVVGGCSGVGGWLVVGLVVILRSSLDSDSKKENREKKHHPVFPSLP